MASIYESHTYDLAATWSADSYICDGNSPSLAQLADGVIFCSYEDGGDSLIRESEDSAGSWSAAFASIEGTRPFLWTDLDAAILYRVYLDTDVYFHYSGDRGDNWSSPVSIATPGDDVDAYGVTLRDGAIQVNWKVSGSWVQYRSTDGGATWSSVP